MRASKSAQETVSGHAFSTAALTVSMKLKPRSVRFGFASFSAVLFAVESRRTEPSHPCTDRRRAMQDAATGLAKPIEPAQVDP